MSLTEIMRRVRKVEKEQQQQKHDLKRVKDILEMSSVVNPLAWKDFTDLDRQILKFLLEQKFKGATSTEIAQNIDLEAPKVSGRVKVWHRLKRMQRVSIRMKGDPIVILQRKRWHMNFEDFTFKDYPTV